MVTLVEARAKAKSEIGKISNNIDPLEERRQAAKGETMKIVCADYLENHAKKHKKSWQDDQRRIEKHILPMWGAHKINSITDNDIKSFHRKMGSSAPYGVNPHAIMTHLMG